MLFHRSVQTISLLYAPKDESVIAPSVEPHIDVGLVLGLIKTI